MSARYGAGDALGVGWAGMQASGMKEGQYGEYLRAMQRVMEEGISKGFSKSAKEIAGDLTFIQGLGGGSELWKGERGQQRLSEMNAGLAGTTGLQSTTDIVAFRAAQNVLKKWEEQGIADKKWAEMVGTDKDGNPLVQQSGSYHDPLIMLERGLTSDLLNELMMMTGKIEEGSRDEIINRLMQTFNIDNYKGAVISDQWKKITNNGEDLTSSEDTQALIDKYTKAPPPPDNDEFGVAKNIEEIKNLWTNAGMLKWDENFPKAILDELEKARQGLPGAPKETPIDMSPTDAVKFWEQEYDEAEISGDSNRMAHAHLNLLRAREIAMNPGLADVLDKDKRDYQDAEARSIVRTQTGRMFDENIGSREDKEGHRKSNSMFDVALSSEDSGERDAAIEFSRMLGSINNKKLLEVYNKNDKWNELGSANDIYGMISILQGILDATKDNGNINIIYEEP
jgi:hypothetical protein